MELGHLYRKVGHRQGDWCYVGHVEGGLFPPPLFLIDIYCGEEVVVLIKGCDGCRKSGD